MKKISSIVFVLAMLIMATNNSYATKMLHRNLEELTQLADRIFVGVCFSAVEKEERLSNGAVLVYVEYNFEVKESIKGVNSQTVRLRQFGRASGLGSIIGMPAYTNGNKYLLFLRNDSEFGLASPIGLGQGAFHLMKKNGMGVASNAFNNQGLFNGMDARSSKYAAGQGAESGKLSAAQQVIANTKKGPVRADLLIELVKTILSQ